MFATRPSTANIRSTARAQPARFLTPRLWNAAGPWQPKHECSITSRAGCGGYSSSKSTKAAPSAFTCVPP